MENNLKLISLEEMKDFYHEDIDKLLHNILSYSRKITSCDAGTIYLKDGDDIISTIFQNDTFCQNKIDKIKNEFSQLRFKIQDNSATISVESILKNKIITVDDVYSCSKFDFLSTKNFDALNNYKTKSILTAPLVTGTNHNPIGVIQLINKKDQDGNLIAFTKSDREFISMSSYFISLSIINTQNIIQTLNNHNNILEKELKLRTEKLIELANKDPLTHLFNRRYLKDITSHLINISTRLKSTISVLLIDIDNFKSINDNYGHAIGDDVIVSLANILIKSTRQSDIAVRFGGEEFVIILPNTSKENAINLAQNIRKDVENQVVAIDNNKISYAISVGVSIVNDGEKNFDKSLNRADKALYNSKKNGKNQVSFLD
jgi:diguanylate cyclase (GGDEF)-like protein